MLYTHRSNYLHTLRALQADAVALTARDSAAARGADVPRQRLGPAVRRARRRAPSWCCPGRHLDGASLARLMRDEGVTVAVGVQTVWLGLVDHLDRTGEDAAGAGARADRRLELPRRADRAARDAARRAGADQLGHDRAVADRHHVAARRARAVAGTAGRPPIGLDLKLTDADGATLPEQRGALGHLKVAGASVLDRYLGADADALDAEGYFDTGDLAMIDAAGNLTIRGRAKDLIKSGGEWINPAEIEAIVGAHPSVRHVAVIARPDPKWGERPVLMVERDGAASDGARAARPAARQGRRLVDPRPGRRRRRHAARRDRQDRQGAPARGLRRAASSPTQPA